MSDRDRAILRIRLCSTSNINDSYTIEVNKTKNTVVCDCIGFNTHGVCKHIKFYKTLIKMFLDAKPGSLNQ
jgi:hypothetical protein